MDNEPADQDTPSRATWSVRVLTPEDGKISVSGPALVSEKPLSFWGGYDPASGEIIDRRHPLSGENAAGRIFVLPSGRGSSTASAILLEAIRQGTAPAAIVLGQTAPILTLGAVISEEFFDRTIPVVVLKNATQHIHQGEMIRIDDNWLTILKD